LISEYKATGPSAYSILVSKIQEMDQPLTEQEEEVVQSIRQIESKRNTNSGVELTSGTRIPSICETQGIIEKMAHYVVKNGPAFESLASTKGNPPNNFNVSLTYINFCITYTFEYARWPQISILGPYGSPPLVLHFLQAAFWGKSSWCGHIRRICALHKGIRLRGDCYSCHSIWAFRESFSRQQSCPKTVFLTSKTTSTRSCEYVFPQVSFLLRKFSVVS